MKDKKINPQMSILELIEKHPETISVFQKLGTHCFGCPFAGLETLEQLAEKYKLNIEDFIKELEKTTKKHQK